MSKRTTIEDFHALAEKRGFAWVEKGHPKANDKTNWKCPEGDDHIWATAYSEIKRGRGCPFCHTAGSGSRPSANHNFAIAHPELAKHWHPTLNKKGPSQYTPTSGKVAWWQCPKSKLHVWDAKIQSLVNNKSAESQHKGCSFCSGMRVCADNSLAHLEPELAKQWHPTKNKDTPHDVTTRNNKIRWWVCKFGHDDWPAQIASRTAGAGCPRCTNQFSKLELRIYCELDKLFHDVIWRDRSLGKEIDVFLPKQSIGIEIDYEHTHGDKRDLDIAKAELLRTHGIDLVRVRERSLGALSPMDVLFNKRDDHILIVMNLIRQLIDMVNDKAIVGELQNYLKKGKLRAVKEFKKIFANSPSPIYEKSVEFLHPELIDEWAESNHPLLPSMFTPGSGQIVGWMCRVCGHKWPISIGQRTDSKNRKGTGCPSCAGIVEGEGMTSRNRAHITADYNLEKLFPEVAKEWHPPKNEFPANEAAPFAMDNAWWLCENGHEWQQHTAIRVKDRLSRGCETCRSVGFCSPDLAEEWDFDLNEDTPFDVTVGCKEKRWWKCSNGHPSYQAVVDSRRRINKSGQRVGCRPCGYQLNRGTGKLRRAKWVGVVNEIKEEGITSLREIAEEMNARGVKPYKTDKWNHKNLGTMLRKATAENS